MADQSESEIKNSLLSVVKEREYNLWYVIYLSFVSAIGGFLFG